MESKKNNRLQSTNQTLNEEILPCSRRPLSPPLIILGTVSVALATEHDANLANRYPGFSASAAQFQGRNVSLNAGQTIVMDRAARQRRRRKLALTSASSPRTGYLPGSLPEQPASPRAGCSLFAATFPYRWRLHARRALGRDEAASMHRQTKWFVVAGLLATVASTQVTAEAVPKGSYPAEPLRPYVPHVSMENDRRVTPGRGKSRVGASGLVRCGGAVGTAQLTLRNNIITTAAHVLIGEGGQPRSSCVFEPAGGGAAVPIDTRSIRAGSRSPMSEPATRDWAVARLTAPVAGATPYGIAGSGSRASRVSMIAGGNKRADAMGADNCRARGVTATSPEGVREFAIDCSAAAGSSGAALTAGHRITGIHIGNRSSDPTRPQPFSSTHYNFAITLDGAFRRALLGAAR